MAPAGVLFSSPLRARPEPIVLLSSSPEFPSLSEIVPKPARKQPLRSGSRAAPIPLDAPRTFTSAASLWRSLDSSDDSIASGPSQVVNRLDKDTGRNPTPAPAIVLAPEENRCKTASEPATSAVEKKSKRPRKNKQAEEVGKDTAKDSVAPPKQKPTKKPALAVASEDGQTTIPKGKVTKRVSKGKSQTGGRAATSRHLQTDQTPVEPIEIEDTIELEPALKRRTDWTPIKDTATTSTEYEIAPEDSLIVSLDGEESATNSSNAVFRNLLDTYGCKKPEGTDKTKDAVGFIDVLGKRKQLDLVTTAKTPETSPTKSKAPKKKARTITELATAAYRSDQNSDDRVGAQQPPLFQDFCADDAWQSEGVAKPPGEKRQASKKGAKVKTSKKAEPRRQILLSPASAMRQVSRQDFVFGTSSQLATEHDPVLLRDLQEAMRASNQGEPEDVFATSSPSGEQSEERSRRGRLWTAGARGVDGALLDIEIIDLAASPSIPKDLTNPAVINALANDPGAQSTGGDAAARVSTLTAEAGDPAGARRSADLSTRSANGEQTALRKIPLSSTPAMPPVTDPTKTLAEDEPPASNQEQGQVSRLAQPGPAASFAKDKVEIRRPTYELYTDAQLAKEIQGYGFKAVKRRTAMIALLDQCWTSKSQAARVSSTQAAPLSTSSTGRFTSSPVAPAPSTTRPRGRPRKETSATAAPTASTSAQTSPPGRSRGRPRKGSRGAASPKASRTMSPPRPTLSARASSPRQPPMPSTPNRRKKAPHTVIEIADSDAEDASAFVSSRSASPEDCNTFSSPQPVDLSINEDSELSLSISPTGQQSTVFEFITKAVTTAPRSSNPQNPSWHEKMLMYDPIVLEDLSAWLNSGQLDRVGYDGEVAPGEVKQWCESKSVCCLWKFNLNGKERKRF